MIYFVTYAWRRVGETDWHLENQLLHDSNPIDFLAELEESPGEQYRIVFFHEFPSVIQEINPVVKYAIEENAGEIPKAREAREHYKVGEHGRLVPAQAERDDTPEGV